MNTYVIPTGKITVMNVERDGHLVEVDINDATYKDDDERCLRASFSLYDITDDIGYVSTDKIEKHLQTNAINYQWKEVNA